MAALDADVAPKFKLHAKSIVVLGYVVLTSVQTTLYALVVPRAYRATGWFWMLSLLELVVVVAGFARTFAPSTFHAMSCGKLPLLRFWDVAAHPVPECRTLHDALATEFADATSTKAFGEVY
ncbi:Aste57867_16609 [Aphanomyces stellatus]|uniref:Aste57867_16609 protein n=1 Tax=Aphanomyces stellatus TaxID=120398 RepID=A0A485L7S1_9STRA|nr:hypothetical protein As57867_016552 [Aphanomyces stellatus]VFT93380.1 Aste57867_16609 [Aphanomyces stellatus]